MLQQLNVEFTNGLEYCIFYDDDHMTQEQAEKELEFMDWGMGFDEKLYPYYLIVSKKKKPILSCIKEYLTDMGYNLAHSRGVEEKYD